MIIETIAITATVALAGWYLWNKYGTTVEATLSKNLTADALIADAKAVVDKIEAWVETEAKNVETYVVQKTGLETTITAAQADIQKAKDFADKVKAIV